MFFSNGKIAEKYNYLDAKFTAAYKWLAETDIKALPDGSYPIVDGVTANVQRYATSPAETRSFETHEKYFDIQYMVSGIEAFGVARREDCGPVTEDKPADDVTFYAEPDYAGVVILHEGDLIVVAPEDAHKPRCSAGAPMDVVKVVVKVKV